MPVTTPPVITALPAAPDPNDRATFNTRAYPWAAAQAVLATEVGAVAANVAANATDAKSSADYAGAAMGGAQTAATNADGSATAAAGSATIAASSATNAADSAAAAAASAATASSAVAFVDTNPVVKGSADATKQIRFEVDGLTTGTTRVITVPDKNGTLAMTSDITGLSGTAAGTIELLTGTAIASAATINLGTATGNRVHITGTTTITTVTLTRGPRTVIFDGILTLTHHATNNNLPGAANITTAVGDRAIYEGDGTTVRCIAYTKASGLPVVAASASVGDHEIVVHTGNGYGSTNTKIRRFTTAMTNVGTSITYADSATLGASFTINEAGLYSLFYTDGTAASSINYGMSLNSALLATGIASIAVANSLCGYQTATSGVGPVIARIVRLVAGDVVRPHTEGNPSPAATSLNFLAIRKVGV